MNNRKGFTLIELLVVIGIIGLLATIAVAAFGNAQQRARDTKRVADVRAIISAFAAASADDANNKFCVSGAALGTGVPGARVSTIEIWNGTDCTVGGGGSNQTSKYINLANVRDPRNTNACAAKTPAAACDYTIVPTAAGSMTDYTFGFVTESDAVQGLGASQFHTANQNGLVN